MVDRTTKALLLAIALGLWMNVAHQWLSPAVLRADAESDITAIATDLHRIFKGTCLNDKIC
jgi:hypothetical protein